MNEENVLPVCNRTVFSLKKGAVLCEWENCCAKGRRQRKTKGQVHSPVQSGQVDLRGVEVEWRFGELSVESHLLLASEKFSFGRIK